MLISATDGVRLEVRSVGSGAPLVFVHEFSGDARSWDPQVGFFSRYYRCTVYCARGYPPSDVPTSVGAYDQIRAAEDLADVVRRLPTVRRTSSGCRWAALPRCISGLRHPQLVRSLVVAGVGYGAKPEQQAEHSASSCSARPITPKRSAWRLLPEISPKATMRNACAPRTRPRWLRFAERTGRAFGDRDGDDVARRARHAAIAMASRGRLRGLDRPVLLVAGDEDTPCLEPSLFLKATLPDAALCVMPRTGHLINLEEPALFNTIVIQFSCGR